MVEPSTRSERFPNERERFSGSSTIRNSFNQAGPPPRGAGEGWDRRASTRRPAIRFHGAARRPKPTGGAGTPLLADAELGDDSLIPFGIVLLQVVKQATPLADEHEQTAARTVIFLVRFEVLRQLTNALAQQSDLNFRAAGVGSMGCILVNEGFLLLSG